MTFMFIVSTHPIWFSRTKLIKMYKTSMVKGRKMTQERVYTGEEDPA